MNAVAELTAELALDAREHDGLLDTVTDIEQMREVAKTLARQLAVAQIVCRESHVALSLLPVKRYGRIQRWKVMTDLEWSAGLSRDVLDLLCGMDLPEPTAVPGVGRA